MRMTVKSYLKTVEKAKAEAEARAIAAAATLTASSNTISPSDDMIARPSGDSPRDDSASAGIPPAAVGTERLTEDPGDDVQPSIEVSWRSLVHQNIANIFPTGCRCRRHR